MEDALVRSAIVGRVDEVKALLASGADPNAMDAMGRLALGEASLRGHVGCVKVAEVVSVLLCTPV